MAKSNWILGISAFTFGVITRALNKRSKRIHIQHSKGKQQQSRKTNRSREKNNTRVPVTPNSNYNDNHAIQEQKDTEVTYEY